MKVRLTLCTVTLSIEVAVVDFKIGPGNGRLGESPMIILLRESAGLRAGGLSVCNSVVT